MRDTTPDHGAYASLTVTKKPGSQAEITGEVPVEQVHAHRTKALERMRKRLELPGFRKGHVPAEMAEEHFGEAAIMQETAELALTAAYAAIVADQKLDVVGRPEVTITKLAPGNPIGFKIESALYPEVVLPDYASIAAAEREKHADPAKEAVSEEEVQKELERLRDVLAQQEAAADGDSTDAEGADAAAASAARPIDDAFAKELGPFESLTDLKEKLAKQMRLDKQQKSHDKRRLAIVEAIIAKTKTEVPEVFVEGELDQMVATFKERVERAGMEVDQYLQQVEKSLDDLRKEWRADAQKRAKLQLALTEIAKKEGIKPDAQKLEREIAHVREHYPEAEEQAVRAYVSAQMLNEAVFRVLEGDAPPEDEDHVQDHAHAHD